MGLEDLGFVFDEVRSFVAEVDGHGSKLPTRPGQPANRVGDWGVQQGMNRTTSSVSKPSASKARRHAAAAIAATSVLALGVATAEHVQFGVRT